LSQPRPTAASLFVTCVVDQLYPEIGESTVRVLTRLGVQVEYDARQTCCGQPAFNSGYWSDARPSARRFLDMYRDNEYVVIPSGSCASMVKVFYEELFHDDPAVLAEVHAVAPRVFELSQFLVDVLGVKTLPLTGRREEAGKVTYHEACHLRRELGAKTQARGLIEAARPGDLVEMEQSDVCCGFGGTFSVKYSEISGAMLKDKIDNIARTGAASVVACDSTCLMQIAGGMEKRGTPVRPLHLAQLLDEATAGILVK